MAISKKKKRTVAAVAIAAVLLLGGTFAWQSISQTALNEASDVVNPGGRLHDDFDGTNKDVYVENFAEDPIYARVKLDEYFEIKVGNNEPTVITTGATKDDQSSWITHDFAGGNPTDEYWTWDTDGSTTYMPTFNKDKDSLKADINGTYVGLDGTDGVNEGDEEDRYADYVDYSLPENSSKTADALYDADTDNLDNDGTEAIEETHNAQSTLGAALISMEQWIADGSQPGEFWVYDTDGWVYWAQAIQPDTATGLLLDGIELVQVMDDSWYYGINVVGQFITANDLGKDDSTGFYADGAPTENALALLTAIGVDTGDSENQSGDETQEPSTENYSIDFTTSLAYLNEANAPVIASESRSTITLGLKNGEESVDDVTWDTSYENLTVDGDVVSLAESVTPTDSLEVYTVKAIDSEGRTLAEQDIYANNPEKYNLVGTVVSEETGSVYIVYDYVPYEGEGRLGLTPTQICLYRIGDEVNKIYYFIETTNFAVSQMAEAFDEYYSNESEMELTTDHEWPAE